MSVGAHDELGDEHQAGEHGHETEDEDHERAGVLALQRRERGHDRSELGDVVLEVVEDLTRQRIGEPDQDLRDRDETDHPDDRDR